MLNGNNARCGRCTVRQYLLNDRDVFQRRRRELPKARHDDER